MNRTTNSRLCTTRLTSDEISGGGCHWDCRVVSMSSDCPRSNFFFFCARACWGDWWWFSSGCSGRNDDEGVPNPIASSVRFSHLRTRVHTRLTPTMLPWVLSSLIMKLFVHLKNSAPQQKVITVIRAIRDVVGTVDSGLPGILLPVQVCSDCRYRVDQTLHSWLVDLPCAARTPTMPQCFLVIHRDVLDTQPVVSHRCRLSLWRARSMMSRDSSIEQCHALCCINPLSRHCIARRHDQHSGVHRSDRYKSGYMISP